MPDFMVEYNLRILITLFVKLRYGYSLKRSQTATVVAIGQRTKSQHIDKSSAHVG